MAEHLDAPDVVCSSSGGVLKLGADRGAVICRACGRGWRLPADGRLSQLNYDYLWDHARDHLYPQRRRPKQVWRVDIAPRS